uniref:B30.2/SPRY domain-containing protein n=1 Tax=Acanthochromis polyacanthus TaxID=80966 RepID=A0A3Q1GSC0_9TELE
MFSSYMYLFVLCLYCCCNISALLAEEEFLQHSCQITLDPNTANMHMILSEENKKATYKRKKQAYPSHPERFMDRSQVLSREALTGRHYWEVEWDGLGIFVAVAYKDISRTGDDSKFGNNDKSWALLCSDGDYELTHKGHGISISAPLSSKVGVYLDYRAGILSFYSVSDSMTLIHRVQTTFTQPLYVGLRLTSNPYTCTLQPNIGSEETRI